MKNSVFGYKMQAYITQHTLPVSYKIREYAAACSAFRIAA